MAGNIDKDALDNPAEPRPAEIPMACRRAGVLIEKSIAGAASDTERRQLEAHLAECPACRDYASDARFISTVFSGIRLRFPEAPQPSLRNRRGRLLRWVPLAAAAALLLAAGLCLLNPSQQPAENTPPAVTSSGGAVAEYLGVGFAVGRDPVPTEPAAENGDLHIERVPMTGLLVVEVMPGSWAGRAGICPGDRILEASGVRLAGSDGRWALDYMLRNLPDGGAIPLVVFRNGRVLRLEYRAGER